MEVTKTFVFCLIAALAGCTHLTKSYTSVEESDVQKLVSFAQEFSLLNSNKKKEVCKLMLQQKKSKSDLLLRVKHAYMVAVYPPCGSLDDAITDLEKTKVETLDHELELFLDYQMAVMGRIKKDNDKMIQYKDQLKEAQDKLDEIKSIEKALNNRGN